MSNKEKEIYILAIESSCDDTSAAVLRNDFVLSNIVTSQEIHKQYGGVVPELASREHQKNIVPVVEVALRKAGITKKDLSAIAFTRGPGLMGSLHVGVSFAKSMAYALGIPMIEANHMQAHVLAHFIRDHEGRDLPELPFLCLTVSGGHTQIVLVESPYSMKVIGETIDDAAGEAFDKAAKVLGLPYPGGPLIDRYAKEGNPHAFSFPIPKIPGLNYSFSGLKTSFLYLLRDKEIETPGFAQANINDLCASLQMTIVKVLLQKFLIAVEERGVRHIALAGGVSANSALRKAFMDLQDQGLTVHIPPFSYCTDNAAMIGISAWFKYLNSDFADLSVAPLARWSPET